MKKLTPESDGSTKDLLADNIAKLKELFPEVFAEGKIDFDALKQLLGDYVEPADERYSFTWNGKSKARWLAQTRSMGTLRPCPEESIDWDTTQNLFIEGDNLEVLKQLQKSYYKKIKMIYIDPPYNTGNDFIYPDNFRDSIKNYMELTGQTDGEGRKLSTNPETSGRYHTDWLNMMYPRLKLARNLLREDGVIFISIDDSEVANLRKICDEIFGEENFIGMFVINSSPSAIDYGHIAKMHEYVLFYAKSIDAAATDQLTDEDKQFQYEDKAGPYNIYPLYNGNVAFNPKTRPNLFYPFYLNPLERIGDDFYVIDLEPHDGWVQVLPVISRKDGIQRVWRWGKELSRDNLNGEIVGYKTEDGEFRVVQKARHTGKVIRSLQTDKDISTRRGTAEVEEIFGAKIFPFPKSVELIRRFIAVCLKDNGTVLDFFAGSGTTAHAVLELNKQDGGSRKFIMVQLPEPCDKESGALKTGYTTIAEIGKERIRRVIKKLNDEDATTTAKETQNPALFSATASAAGAYPGEPGRAPDRGFKVFKLDSSNIKTWDPNFNQLEHTLLSATEKMKPDRTEADVIYEVLLKYGLDLTLPIEKRTIADRTVYIIGGGTLVVCLGMNMTLKIVEQIAALKDEFKPESPPGMRMVFKDNGFANDRLKTNAVQILKQRGIEDVRAL